MRRWLLVFLCCVPTLAYAGGFLTARFGGEQGHPTTSDPTALYFNPAGLSLAGGTRLHLNGVVAFRFVSYDRPASTIDSVIPAGSSGTGTPDDALSANASRATLANLAAIPFGALVSDLGVKNLAVALGVFVPFGGSAGWNPNEEYRGSSSYPGAVDGVQRWSGVSGYLRSWYVSAGGSYTFEKARLSIGAAVNLVVNQLGTLRARNASGTDDLVSAGMLQEGRSVLDVSNVTASLGAGVIWRPDHRWWLGVSYQSQPGFGEQALTGSLRQKLGAAPETVQAVEMLMSYPDILRLGLRVRPVAQLELRLFGDYQRWSVFNQQCILDASNPARACRLEPDGQVAPGSAGIVLAIPRRWTDGFGLRFGLSYFARDTVELFVGAGYDSNVVPNTTLDPGLIDQEKVSVSVGGRFELAKRRLVLAVTYAQFVFIDRTVPPQPQFQAPSRSPDNGGTYRQSVGALSIALEYRFKL